MNRVFIQAAILSLFIFLIGIMVGVWLDNYRLAAIRSSLSEADLNSYDARLLNSYLQRFGKDYCNVALEQNLVYNDRIYQQGKNIEGKLDSSTFTPEIQQEWRRYTLLQVQFWLNSIELKDKCNFDYHTVVHLFRQKNATVQENINNKILSTQLLELKEKCGRKMMLIPITVDTDLIVVDAISKQFNLTDYPDVIVDESSIFHQPSKESLNTLLKC